MKNTNSLLTKSAVLLISMMLTSSQAINGVIPQMRDALGITESQAEFIGTLPSIMIVTFIYFSNAIAEKIGMKTSVILGLTFVGIGGSLPAVSDHYAMILFSRILLGIGIGLFNSLAVSYINLLYNGSIRAAMLGIRNSMESLGQMVLIFLAGIFVNTRWNYSFLVYAVALPLAVLFAWRVPALAMEKRPVNEKKSRLDPRVFLLVLFSLLLVLNQIAVSIRFAAIAKGIDPNIHASLYLSLTPLAGILAGFAFGFAYRYLNVGTFYIGILTIISGNLFFFFSGDSVLMLLIGLFFASFSGAWCLPYIFDNIERFTDPTTVATATSLIFIGCNFGNFFSAISMALIDKLSGSTTLKAPFAVFAVIFSAVLIFSIRFRQRNAV